MTREVSEDGCAPPRCRGGCPVNGTGLTGGVGLVNGTGLTNAIPHAPDGRMGPGPMARARGFTNGGGRAVGRPLTAPTDQINGLVRMPGLLGGRRRDSRRRISRAMPWTRGRARRRLEELATSPATGLGGIPPDPVSP